MSAKFSLLILFVLLVGNCHAAVIEDIPDVNNFSKDLSRQEVLPIPLKNVVPFVKQNGFQLELSKDELLQSKEKLLIQLESFLKDASAQTTDGIMGAISNIIQNHLEEGDSLEKGDSTVSEPNITALTKSVQQLVSEELNSFFNQAVETAVAITGSEVTSHIFWKSKLPKVSANGDLVGIPDNSIVFIDRDGNGRSESINFDNNINLDSDLQRNVLSSPLELGKTHQKEQKVLLMHLIQYADTVTSQTLSSSLAALPKSPEIVIDNISSMVDKTLSNFPENSKPKKKVSGWQKVRNLVSPAFKKSLAFIKQQAPKIVNGISKEVKHSLSLLLEEYQDQLSQAIVEYALNLSKKTVK